MKAIRIHFLGRSNTFRCQLAAAYFRSIAPAGYEIRSSGLRPDTKYIDVARQVAGKWQIGAYLFPAASTVQEQLDAADVVVCMGQAVYYEALSSLHVDARKTIVWGVESLDETAIKHKMQHHESGFAAVAEQVFERLAREAQQLLTYLTNGSWVDIVTADDEPTGLRLPISWACDRGYWHRSAHVVLLTPQNDFVVEKRSSTITMYPNEIDITLGGFVDSGEDPLAAALRETQEELGIVLDRNQIAHLEVKRANVYYPSLRKHVRAIKHVYVAKLRPDQMLFSPQTIEVAGVGIMTLAEVQQLIRRSRLKSFGRISQAGSVYDDIIQRIAKKIKRHRAASKRPQKHVK